jgi:ubiquinone/menaquinone biosynthesis C-methylase UbiE
MLVTLRDKIAAALLKVFASDHPFRKRWNDPERIIQGAGVQSGQKALEVGCGRGFFTLPLAEKIGQDGYLYALDVTQAAVDYVTQKMASANLSNVRVFQANALDTGLPSGAVDLVLLFGVIPSPTLPLSGLLPELHRVLRPDGSLAVWTAVPGWSPRTVVHGGLFAYLGKLDDVHKFRRV